MLEYLVFIGFPLAAFGIFIYLKDVLRGKARPNRVSWLMWAITPLIATAAALSKGVGLAVVPVFMAGLGPLCILIASFYSKNAYWRLTKFDYICGFFSVLALIFWLITREANVAIIFAMVSDISAAVPTLKKAWTNPETESVMPYMAGLINASTSFAAVKYWIFSEYAFAAYMVFINSCLIFSIYGRRILDGIFLRAGKNKV